jgi:hypothetical protein
MSGKLVHSCPEPVVGPVCNRPGSQMPLEESMKEGSRDKYWLFSAPIDLGVFLGSPLLALAAVGWGAWAGLLSGDKGTPDWAWVPAVLLIDVAHVYATGFRVYFDPGELRRRPWLYSLVPLFGFMVGIALYSEGEDVFWRVLAYVAVFHFVRQQYGWVALYRARLGERDRLGKWIDSAAIYLATLYPLLYWQSHLPRNFTWFKEGDFAAIPGVLADIVQPAYWTALVVYALRSAYRWLVCRRPNPGKDIIVASTALCWYVGIVALNSDYAFTVTNVITHGVPYLALVYWYRQGRQARSNGRVSRQLRGLAMFLATLWLLAYVEELIWDRGVWQERAWLFGSPWPLEEWKWMLVPALAVPQLTHYVLDGFIWRRKSNPALAAMVKRPIVASS